MRPRRKPESHAGDRYADSRQHRARRQPGVDQADSEPGRNNDIAENNADEEAEAAAH